MFVVAISTADCSQGCLIKSRVFFFLISSTTLGGLTPPSVLDSVLTAHKSRTFILSRRGGERSAVKALKLSAPSNKVSRMPVNTSSSALREYVVAIKLTHFTSVGADCI